MGTEIVKRELAYSPILKSLYDRVFDREVPFSLEAKRLANIYMKKKK